MSRSLLDPYRRAQNGFDTVLRAVPADKLGRALRVCRMDLARHRRPRHLGQEQPAHWATGQEYGRNEGAPGTRHPGQMAGTDPWATWRAARAASDQTLTGDALDRRVTLPALGERPVSAIVTLLVTDLLAHTWDIGHALDLDVQIDVDLIPGSFAWARDNIISCPASSAPSWHRHPTPMSRRAGSPIWAERPGNRYPHEPTTA